MSPTAARLLARRGCLLASAVAALVFAVVALREPYALARELWLIRATGYTALTALFLSLLATPGLRLATHLAPSWARPTPWRALRRALGITAACWGLVHAALTLGTYLWDAWPAVWRWAHLRAGLLTLVILVLLLATSFPRLVGLLRIKLWKPLHRLAYLAALFLFQHLMLSPFAPRRLILPLFAALLVLSLLRLLPKASAPKRRNRKAWGWRRGVRDAA